MSSSSMLQQLIDKGLSTAAGLSVSTDTRNLPAGCVFFALKGENFNGNRYAAQALEKGAQLAVVDEPEFAVGPRIILVDNTLIALQTLAREWREHWGKTVIGITGTNGKTTTKELMAAVLSRKYNVLYTQGNLNNHIGVPLTLLQLRPEHEIAIVEMGASHRGDIRELVEIAEPSCGLVTNVGQAHLLNFGSFEAVMQTKAELYDYLRSRQGYIFRNIDNPYLQQMAGDLPCHSYALEQDAELRGRVVDCTGFLRMEIMGRTLQTNILGAYNAENVLAALSVGMHFGVSLEEGIEAIEAYYPGNNRSMLLKTGRNTLVVDAYNANPTSMRAAIDSFASMAVPRAEQVLVLGNMNELGGQSLAFHRQILDLVESYGFTDVYLAGTDFCALPSPYRTFNNVEELIACFRTEPVTGKYILLKGSRGNRLESLIPVL